MMKFLRRGGSGWVTKTLLAIVVVAFVIGGFAGFLHQASSDTVVRAGDTELQIRDYRLINRMTEVALAQRIGRAPTREEATALGVDRQVLARLVADAVLVEEGRRIDLGLSDDHLLKVIQELPDFAGQSGPQIRQNLARAGFRDTEFVAQLRRRALSQQLLEGVSEAASVPDTLKTAVGLYYGERRTADYLTLAPSIVEPIAPPAADVLAGYFDGHKDAYAAPEYRGVVYAALTPDAIAEPAAVTDAQIKDDYEHSKARFTTAERRRVQQLVYPDAAAAAAAKAELASGKIFEQLVIQMNRKVEDVELGLLARDQIADKTIADAAFALKAGETSDVVNGSFGPVLLRVTEIQPETVQPLDAVKETIRGELALASAGTNIQQIYDIVEDARAGGATLREAVAKAGLKAETVAAVSAAGQGKDDKPIATLPQGPDFLTAVFAGEPNVETTPIQLPQGGYVFFEVTGVEAARQRSLDEVKDRTLADWTVAEGDRLLGERAEALKKRLDGGETIDAIAAAEKLPKGTAASITRQTGPADIGGAATRAVFGGPGNLAAVAPASDSRSKLVLKVTQVAPPADPLSNVPPKEDGRLADMLSTDLAEAYIDRLRTDYPVSTYPAAIERAQAASR